MDCEQVLSNIDNNIQQLLQDNTDFANKLVEMDNRVIELETNLTTVLDSIIVKNNDTNSVSKAILNYLNKVQSFLKI